MWKQATVFALGVLASCATGTSQFDDDEDTETPCELSVCGGSCVDLTSDSSNCGTCGLACAAGTVCEGSLCKSTEETCDAPLTVCSDMCVDTSQSAAHCGGCGLACPQGQVCTAGECGIVCDAPSIVCDDVCIDPLTDDMYCGAADDCTGGTVCPNGEICVNGGCALDCGGGLIDCQGTCIDPLVDNDFCGATLDCIGANDGDVCPMGVELCENGVCVLDCPMGEIECGGACVDPMSDETYCGASGTCMGADDGEVCAMGFVCLSGTCTDAPPVLINFDAVTAPTLFSDTVALSNEYAALGVIFSGPAAGQGGAILNPSSFCMSGESPVNALMFNGGVGYATNPETLTFNPPVQLVSINAGSASSGGSITMTAFDGANTQLDTVTISATCAVQALQVTGADIVTVTISGPSVFGFDDVFFNP